MNDRIIEVGDTPARIFLKDGLVCIQNDAGEAKVAPRDIATLVLAHPAATVTGAAIMALAEAGAALLVCDSKRLPVMLGLPQVGHTTQAERVRIQWEASIPRRNRIWQHIVRLKIARQGEVLKQLTGSARDLPQLSARVRPGDPENLEAVAAARYWPQLFGEGFVRNPESEGPNPALNYGYALLRSAVARALVGAGLHPSIGVHHHNRYDPFCLADDVMEPFRPDVDLVVRQMYEARGYSLVLDAITKRELVAAVLGVREFQGEMRQLGDICHRLAFSIVGCLQGTVRVPEFPEQLRWPPKPSE